MISLPGGDYFGEFTLRQANKRETFDNFSMENKRGISCQPREISTSGHTGNHTSINNSKNFSKSTLQTLVHLAVRC